MKYDGVMSDKDVKAVMLLMGRFDLYVDGELTMVDITDSMSTYKERPTKSSGIKSAIHNESRNMKVISKCLFALDKIQGNKAAGDCRVLVKRHGSNTNYVKINISEKCKGSGCTNIKECERYRSELGEFLKIIDMRGEL